MTPRPPLGAAVIGLGVGERHARTYARDPNARLRWVHDLDAGKAQTLADTLGVGVADEATIFADDGIDIVSIASFDQMHFAQVMAGLAQKKHLFVEKPLCRTLGELADIKSAWKRAGEPGLESNLVLRAAPLYVWLRDAVRNGELGDVYAFDGDYLYGRLHKITDGWRGGVDGYSVMAGGGIHMIDLMMMILDERPETVETIGNRIATKDTDFRYDDFQSAMFRFQSGKIARITANFACAHHHQHAIRIFGTKATFVLDDQGPRLLSLRDPEFREKGFTQNPAAAATPVQHAQLPADKGDLIPDFLRAIQRGDGLKERALRNFDLVAAVAASDRSHASGSPIRIDYV